MTILSHDELRTLLEYTSGPCVSLFLPTHRAGQETRQDPIRLKNLLGQAEEQLIAAGLRAPDAQDILQPARALLDDGLFWQHQSDGLALFCAPDMFQSYRLPINFEELVVVKGRFHIKPLMPLFTNNDRYFILALSQNDVRLFQGTRHSIEAIELHNVPTSMAEALQYDDPEKQQQFFTGTAPKGKAGKGDRPAVFYGTGAQGDESKKDLLRYFHRVDRGISEEVLHNEQAPLVLVGVDYLLPIYREANSYRNLLEDGVTGNPDTLRPDELHTHTWEVIAPYFRQAQQEAADHYRQAYAHQLASRELADIVPAAYIGRVDYMFVAIDRRQWGTFDPKSNQIQLHDTPGPASDDLLDLAAAHTFFNRGTVYAVEEAEMPDDAPAVAVFRY